MKFEICDVDWDSHKNVMVFLEKKKPKKYPHKNVMVFLEKKKQKKYPHKNVQSLEKLSLTLLFF